jgi:hypothetical protein
MAGDDAWSLRRGRCGDVPGDPLRVECLLLRDEGRWSEIPRRGLRGRVVPFYRGWDPGYSGLLTDLWAREAQSVWRRAVESFLRCAQELGTMSLGEAVSRRS